MRSLGKQFFSLAVFGSFFCVLQLNAQPLTGSIKAASEVVMSAHIYWKGHLDIIEIADSSGKFSIARNPKQDTLVVSAVGYKPFERKIAADETFVQINLEVDAKVLQTVAIGEIRAPKTLDTRSVRQVTRFSEKEFTKAACCNLSESFENISAVDVATSDAVTGIKQIQMMGFSGIYVQTQVDNMPFGTGLLSASGLTYIPGVFVKGMQLSKGVGSVTNGYEGMTGSLNIELRKAFHKERMVLNGYYNPMNQRLEWNTIHTLQVSNTWAATTFLHGSGVLAKTDINKDGFQDFPLQHNLNLAQSWMYMKDKWEGNLGVRYINYNQELGVIEPTLTNYQDWQSRHKDERIELHGMLGYIFSKEPERSMGWRVNAVSHKLSNRFQGRSYEGNEKSIRVNGVYRGLVKNTFHRYTAGVSFYGNTTTDAFEDADLAFSFERQEWVPGAFIEWTESSIPKLVVVAGMRIDHHSYFGMLYTPRLHAKYTLTKNTEWRLGGGRGQRTATPFADYQGIFSSGRKVNFLKQPQDGFYGLQQEVSWNVGHSLSRSFKMFARPATWVVDYYYTWFDNQLQVDRDFDAGALYFYNTKALGLRSYSHSASIELDMSPARRTDIRMAYRFIDSRSGYLDGTTRLNPLISPHRFFINAAYETRSGWSFDVTANWQSAKRLPQGANLPDELLMSPTYSPSYMGLMAQVLKKINKKFEVYLGGENLLNIRQDQLIRLASEPLSPYFDPSLIWGPSFGAMGYIGFRYYVY
jgi:outer membrane receptor for ferrienterochelin and colicins